MSYWNLTATGTITGVARENIDKSGRNPRFMITYTLATESTSGAPDDAELPETLEVRAKSNELERMTGSADPFAEGDRVEVLARAVDMPPLSFYLLRATRLDG